MKKLIIIITFSVALSCMAQERLFFQVPYESVTTDVQGNVYLTRGYNLDMFPKDGSKQLNYGDPSWGVITRVDANIASKILVFYLESGTIALLDNELSPICATLNLFDQSLATVSLAAMGNPNKIVLYDDANQDLIITDISLNVLSQSHVSFPGEFHPTDMQVVTEHRIALLDTLHGICLFDFYGTFEREIPIPNITAMQLMKDCIIYLKDNKLYRYDIPSPTHPMSLQEMDIDLQRIKTFHLWKNLLYYIDMENSAWVQHLVPEE
ncbi:MAG: hypothetical protein J6X51_00435 [Bacteroidales bacterium]|nr:hypothetical protein [Bacteroidales bacterium]